MNTAIEEFIKCKRIAVVGLSRRGKKFGNSIFSELSKRGYEVFAVHPEAEEIGGAPCYRRLGLLAGMVDAVVISIPPGAVPGVLREAASAGVKNVWLQQGAESSEAVSLGNELGLSLVPGKCVLMYAPPVEGFHAWHRAFNLFFAKL
jgi:predicted CoA-binding protein